MRISDWSSDVCSSDLADARLTVMRFLLGFDGWVRSRIKTDRRQTWESSGGEQLTPSADPLPRLFVKEEGDCIDARLDDRDPARERDRSGHRISDAEPDRQVDRR